MYVYFSIPLRKHYDGHDCYAAYTAVNSTESVQRNSQNTESAQGRRSHSAVPITYCVRDTVTSPLTSGSSRSVGANGSGHFEKRDTTSTSDTKDACRWAATYNGEAFGLKHSVSASCHCAHSHNKKLLYTVIMTVF